MKRYAQTMHRHGAALRTTGLAAGASGGVFR
jgi:hypothetical protein